MTQWIDISDSEFHAVAQEKWGEVGFVLYVAGNEEITVSTSILMVL